MPVLLISGYFTLSDKGALQFVFFCGTSRLYKGQEFLVCINSNTCLNAELFLRSQNLIACFSHTVFFFFFPAKFIIPVSVLQNPARYYGYTTSYYNFPPNSEGCFLNDSSACFSAGDICHLMGIGILRDPKYSI